jgi:hypothetical protein
MATESRQGQGGQQSHRANEGTLGEVASGVRDRAEDVASSVASTAGQAWDSTRQAASAVADTAGDAWGELTGLMRRYPFGTLFVGIGLGFVLSRIIENQGTDQIRRFGSDLYDRLRDYTSDVASRFESRHGPGSA